MGSNTIVTSELNANEWRYNDKPQMFEQQEDLCCSSSVTQRPKCATMERRGSRLTRQIASSSYLPPRERDKGQWERVWGGKVSPFRLTTRDGKQPKHMNSRDLRVFPTITNTARVVQETFGTRSYFHSNNTSIWRFMSGGKARVKDSGLNVTIHKRNAKDFQITKSQF